MPVFTLDHRRIARLAAAATLIGAAPLSADEILFNNGDRLTGTVTAMDADSIRLQSELFGEMNIPRSAVAHLNTDFEPEKQDSAIAPADPEPAPPPPRDMVSRTSDFVVGMIRPYSPFGWSGNIAFGANLDRSETTSKEFRFNLDANKTIGRAEYQAGTYYEFQESEESDGRRITDTDRYGGYFGYTRLLTSDFLLTGDTRIFANQVQEIDLQYDAAILLGRRFEMIKDLALRFDLGRTATYVVPASGESEWSYLWEARQSLEYRLAEAFRLEQSFRYQIDPDDTEREAIIWDLSAILRMNEWVNTVFKYEFENSTLATSDPIEEERISASLAFPF